MTWFVFLIADANTPDEYCARSFQAQIVNTCKIFVIVKQRWNEKQTRLCFIPYNFSTNWWKWYLTSHFCKTDKENHVYSKKLNCFVGFYFPHGKYDRRQWPPSWSPSKMFALCLSWSECVLTNGKIGCMWHPGPSYCMRGMVMLARRINIPTMTNWSLTKWLLFPVSIAVLCSCHPQQAFGIQINE